MDRKDVLRKIALLKKKEESLREKGTEESMEEAKAAAAKITKLQVKYKISQVDVTEAQRNQEDPIGKETWWPEDYDVRHRKKRIEWLERLARVVANANFCEILVMPGSNEIAFIGRESDREVAMYLYGFLARQIEHHCDKIYERKYNRIYNRNGDTSQMEGWKGSFRRGAIATLRERLDKLRDTELEKASEGENALVKRERALVRQAKRKYSGGKAQGLKGRRGFNWDGLQEGQKFAEDLPIRKGLDNQGNNGNTKELPSS